MDFDKFVNKGPIRTPQVKLYNKNIFYISYHHCYHDHDHQAFGSFPVFSWVICLMFLPPAARLNQRIAGFLQNPSSPSFVFVLDKNFVFVSASSKICGVKSDQVRGKTSIEKKTFSFGHCPNYLNPPWPQFGQLGPFFSEVKIQDLKVSLEIKILYIILYICNIKNS